MMRPQEKRLWTLTGRIGCHTEGVPELKRDDGDTAEHAARQDTAEPGLDGATNKARDVA